MTQLDHKKTVDLDPRAHKELNSFPHIVQQKFYTLFKILEVDGKLEEPSGKKLASSDGLFEIRVKYRGQWRAIYAYIEGNEIIILAAFAKKTQKTPKDELEKAKNRLLKYK
jgi:phage-related protein